MGFFNKKEKQLVDTPSAPEASAPSIDPPEEEEWIWVDGYKATDKNMQCRNDFQYELGKKYICEGDIVECQNGFHLCMNLGDTFHFYNWPAPSNRYFKVRALVRKKDVESYGKLRYSDNARAISPVDKLVAREIILAEEVSEEELFNTVRKNGTDAFENFEDFEMFRSQELHFSDWIEKKLKEQLRGKYSDLFIELISGYNNYYDLYEMALALYEEGVSADVRTYFILKEAGL